MRIHANRTKRAGAAITAAAAAVALAAGMTGPASAKADRDRVTTQGGAYTPATAKHRVTLITGDRVTIDAKRRVTAIEPAAGREQIPVRTLRTPTGHTLAIPADAQRLITTGKLDQRLFDINELSKQKKSGAAQQTKSLKLIVAYKGSAAGTRSDVQAAGDTTVRRTLRTLNADAITTPKQDAADLWKALTAERGGSTVARHRPDLAGRHPQGEPRQERAADRRPQGVGGRLRRQGRQDRRPGHRRRHNPPGPQEPDRRREELHDLARHQGPCRPRHARRLHRRGHRRQVRRQAQGRGTRRHTLNGKVLQRRGHRLGLRGHRGHGVGRQPRGADIVNLSLGGDDEAGVDPLEATVNKLSKDKGISLRDRRGQRRVSPQRRLARQRGRGPHRRRGRRQRQAGGLLQPGPARRRRRHQARHDRPRRGTSRRPPPPAATSRRRSGQKPEGYLTISGTSMATPHVAGAAALLKQQHPDWKHAELKGALTASTKDGGHKYMPYQQGSGRIAIDKAIKQTAIAKPASLNYGTQQWPHTDDKPVTKKVTYKNLGSEAITLDLTVQTTSPKGDPAPTGFFKLGAKTVKIPAGGTAAVDLTADTKLGGTADGTYSAYVVATGAGQTVRTAAVVDREIERHEVTIKTIGRDGKPAPYYDPLFAAITGGDKGQNLFPYDKSGTAKVRVANGSYLLDWSVFVDPDNTAKGTDWLVRPKLNITKNTTVTLDARKAKPVDIKLGVPGTKLISAEPRYTYEGYESAPMSDSIKGLRTAHLGPEVPDGLGQQWLGTWTKGADTQYDMFLGGKVKKLATGYTKRLRPADFATVKATMGASSPGRKGSLGPAGYLPEAGGISRIMPEQKLPRTRTLHLSALGATKWGMDFEQYGDKDEEGDPTMEGLPGDRPAQDLQGGEDLPGDLQRRRLRPRSRRRHRHLPQGRRAGRRHPPRGGRQRPPGLVPLLGGEVDAVPQRHEDRRERGSGDRQQDLQGPRGRGGLQADDVHEAQHEAVAGDITRGRELDVPLRTGRERTTPGIHGPLHPEAEPGEHGPGRSEAVDPGEGTGSGRRPGKPQVPHGIRLLRRRPNMEEDPGH